MNIYSVEFFSYKKDATETKYYQSPEKALEQLPNDISKRHFNNFKTMLTNHGIAYYFSSKGNYTIEKLEVL